MADERGSRKRSTPSTRQRPTARRRCRPRIPRSPAPTPARCAARHRLDGSSRNGRSLGARACSSTSISPRRAAARAPRSRARRSAAPRGSRSSRLRKVDLDDGADPAGARRHHDDACREEDGLGDRVRYEDRPSIRVSRPDAQQLEVQALSGHLVERAERLVHEQQSRRERERAGDRDALLHPARELPRIVLARSPSSSTSSSISSTRSARFARSQPCISSGSAMFFATVRQSRDRRLEHDSVVAVEAGLRARLPVDGDRRRTSARRCRRSRAGASTSRIPTGR